MRAAVVSVLIFAAVSAIAHARVSRHGLVTLERVNASSLPSYAKAKPAPEKPLEDLPLIFDWSNVDGTNYLTSSWNQHIPTYCGACYLHASLTACQDRIKIAKRASGPDVMLSRQALLNCIGSSVGVKHGGESDGCNGGTPLDVYRYMHDIGLPDETCNHYTAQESRTCNAKAICMNCMPYAEPIMENFNCWAVKDFVKYTVTEFGKVSQREAAIMSEIVAGGPVACSIATDDNFDYNYTGGVWRTNSTNEETNHVIELTGWGETSEGVKFWQARNSWGSYWGDLGFFKLERGVNLLQVESDCWFVRVDWSEELHVAQGKLVGGMYGLREKSAEARKVDVEFRLALAEGTFEGPGDAGIEDMPHSAANASGLPLLRDLIFVLTCFSIGLLTGIVFMRMKKRQEYVRIS
eukprot:Plantae.Rhodophyta-Purpureofilum_apyrenoidigerum.ctg17074.p1 GENE.Plantae.Rhodophyta-Purpureofilum_apyrenoidigerum.ctg17074~~Plantae.Rhodophyta-Purpureofilum_apyrenoidigerum.ctg17074.p1  ORF type:complete len:408 (+),score=61.92 Plantae.Rhodophyta-Purpureofilum_apyrenoidigerum.ctg17074:97-1320(+)